MLHVVPAVLLLQAGEASGSEEEAPAEVEEQEEGEVVAPQTPADKKAQRLAARRAVLKAADDELKVIFAPARCPVK